MLNWKWDSTGTKHMENGRDQSVYALHYAFDDGAIKKKFQKKCPFEFDLTNRGVLIQ